MMLKSLANKFSAAFAAAAAAAATAIFLKARGVHGIEGTELVPIAMITHYTDNDCSVLDTQDFTGYYRNPNAVPGTPEANYTYFCNPEMLPSYAAMYGIINLDSCFVDNGGNWYFQPLGFCGSFVINGKPISVKFSLIDHTTRNTIHTVYSDPNCTVPKVLNGEARSGECFDNNPRGKNGTAKVEANAFRSIGSYQVTVPDAYNLIPSSTSSGRSPSFLISFTVLSLSGAAFLLQ